MECKLVQSLWKEACMFHKKLKTELPYDKAITFLGMYLKECKSGYKRDTCTPIFIAALFKIAKLCNQPRWLQLMNGLRNMVHVQNGILLFGHEEE
jgi:hypothetical protein